MSADDQPTEQLPAPADDDPFVADGEWVAPRRRSRVTTGLVAALLVAIGFLLGVTVANAASAPARVTTQQTGP